MANPLISNYDLSKIFLGNNKTIQATYTNATGSEVTLSPGRIMGRVTANNKVAPQDKDNTDGSQYPRFVLMSSHVVANAASVTVTLCVSGEVDSAKLLFASGETLETVISSTDSNTDTTELGTIHDLLMANSHILLVSGTENTRYDNQ